MGKDVIVLLRVLQGVLVNAASIHMSALCG